MALEGALLHYRTQPGQRHTTRLDVRVVREGVVLARASNDMLADSYGTIIPIEPLMRDWLPGFLQHRTISSQHGFDLRGIQGQAQIGMARRVDFAPQLEVEVRVDDPATLALIESGQITGASLEFVPLAWEPMLREDGTNYTVFRRFSSQPEHCGLSLVDIPSVPDADILAVRGVLPNWAFAVVDPRVLNGEITDATTMQALRWFPHHDPVTHAVQDNAVEDAIRALDGDITVPDGVHEKHQRRLARGFSSQGEQQVLSTQSSRIRRPEHLIEPAVPHVFFCRCTWCRCVPTGQPGGRCPQRIRTTQSLILRGLFLAVRAP